MLFQKLRPLIKTIHQGYFPPWNLWGHKKKNWGRQSSFFLLCFISFEFGPVEEIRVLGIHLIESLTSIKFPVAWRRLYVSSQGEEVGRGR